MKIISIAVEAAPFSFVGGLANGIRGLNLSLAKKCDIHLLTPLHRQAVDYIGKEKIGQLPYHNHFYQHEQFSFPVYFYNNPEYFSGRANIYGHKDDHLRFLDFCYACADWINEQVTTNSWSPNIIHLHDWHTGYLAEIIKTNPKYKALRHIPIYFTIHNYKYQGPRFLQYLPDRQQDHNQRKLAELTPSEIAEVNPLLRGIIYADQLSTVSPQHAIECQTPEYGYNLASYNHQYANKLVGILNGLDIQKYNPTKDVRFPYTPKNFIKQRAKNKKYLQQIYDITTNENAMLCAFNGRLSGQKGLELIPEAFTRLREQGVNLQLIIQGEGDDIYYDLFWELKQKYPQNVGYNFRFDPDLPKQVYAGSDAFLAPSRFEPGGNSVLEAIRYGCVPIARNTGGMANSISQFDLNLYGNGFKFPLLTIESFSQAIFLAWTVFQNKKLWHRVQKNCLSNIRTWDTAASEYINWFQKNVLKYQRVS